MIDLRPEVGAPPVVSPISCVARRLLSSDPSVQIVMVMREDGEVLAHERAIDYEEESTSVGEESCFIYHFRAPGLIFYVRACGVPVRGRLPARIQAVVESPSPTLIR